jgi:pimeloyl-ACP methyl ester carboxylesterase
MSSGTVNLYFQEVGKGDPVLILHGLFGSSDNWRTVSLKLSQKHQVYSIDLRNHGRSPHVPIHDFPSMAEDLFEFIEREELERVTLIGHSMGGKAAMYFAARYPSRLKRLVVVDMAPRAYEVQHSCEIEALKSIDLSQVHNRRIVEEELESKLNDKAIVQFFMKNLNRRNDDTFNWRFNLEVLANQYSKILEAVPLHDPFTGPVLFLRGELSNYIQPDDEHLIRVLYPNALVETVLGSGHWIHAEKPDDFIQLVENFFYST